jgi:hypothetical protein
MDESWVVAPPPQPDKKSRAAQAAAVPYRNLLMLV